MFQMEVRDEAVVGLLNRLQHRMKNLRPAFAVIGEIGKTSVKRNFEVGGRYSGPGTWQGGSGTWLPLSLATLLQGRKYVTKRGKWRKGAAEKLEKRKILVKTGQLMKSIDYKASGDKVVIGSPKAYAAAQNFGLGARSSLKSRRRMPELPARPFLVLQDEDMVEIREELGSYIIS